MRILEESLCVGLESNFLCIGLECIACGGMLLKGESTASVNDTLTAHFGAVYILCRRSEVSSSAGLLNNDRVIALV